VTGHLNPDLIKAIMVLMRRLNDMRQKSSMKHVALYLKACHIYTMQFVAKGKDGSPNRLINSVCYGPHVSLTASGLPRILPSYLRSLLRDQDPKYIKLVLSIFNLYRVLPFQGKVKLSTITSP
jgi:hypothetical protein